MVWPLMKSMSSTRGRRRRRGIVGFDHRLHHALERGDVAADAHLVDSVELIGVDVSVTISTGLCGAWKRSSARSRSGLNEMIGAPRREALRRVVIMRGLLVPGFWPKMKIASAWSKSSSSTVPLPTPMRFRQADAGRLVAHVGAVGEIVGAELAHEELIEERGLVRGAAGGVELRHVRIGQRAQVPRR